MGGPQATHMPPQLTFQMTRALPPFNDNVWHRPLHRRDGTSVPLHLSTILSLPLAYNPLLAGCLGAPVRDPPLASATAAHRDLSTRVHLTRARSASCQAHSMELDGLFTRLSRRGLTHLLHLLAPHSPHSPLRFRTADELAMVGANSRSDRLPYWIAAELSACLSPTLLTIIRAACDLSTAYPQLTLEQLCLASPHPVESWVAHLPSDLICQVACVTTPPPPALPIYTLTAAHTVRPDGRLIPIHDATPDLPDFADVPASALLAVQVWTTTRMAHCDEQRDYESRNPDTVRSRLLLAGPAADRSLLFGDPHGLPAASNPALLSMIPGPTDRAPLPMSVASLDVYSLYHLQLSYRHAIPRTLDPSRPASLTSVSHAHLLHITDHKLSDVRAAVCKASHPDPSLGYLTAHALYMTVQDARPIGNDRCRKNGPTHAMCDICHHVDHVSCRELSTHVLLDCPYSRLVADPIARCLLAVYAATPAIRDQWLTCPSDTLLDTCALLFRTGCPLSLPVNIPQPIASNVAGCLSIALFSRCSRNAPLRSSPRSPPQPVVRLRLSCHTDASGSRVAAGLTIALRAPPRLLGTTCSSRRRGRPSSGLCRRCDWGRATDG